MKKIWIAVLAFTLTSGAFAQDSASAANSKAQKSPMQTEEGVIMKDGKLLMMKDGQTTALTSDLTLDNGAIVTADGRVKNKDGTITTLSDGDYVTMQGSPGNINRWQPKDKMKKDSSK